jgi:hypothetical protein
MSREFPLQDIVIQRVRKSEILFWLWFAPKLPVHLPKDVIRYVCKYIIHTFVIPKKIFIQIPRLKWMLRFYGIIRDWSTGKNLIVKTPRRAGNTTFLKKLIECIPYPLKVLFVVKQKEEVHPWNDAMHQNVFVRNIRGANILVTEHKMEFDFIIIDDVCDTFTKEVNAKVLCIKN